MACAINWWLTFRILEFILGTVCFVLFLMFGRNTYDYLARYEIYTIAGAAFPFLVQIPFLAAYWKHGKPFRHNILNPIVNVVATIAYITSGSLGVELPTEMAFRPTKVTHIMFIMTGFIYFFDLCYWMAKIRTQPSQDPIPAHNPPQILQPPYQYVTLPTEQSRPLGTYSIPAIQLSNVSQRQEYGTPMVQSFHVDQSRVYNAPMAPPYNLAPNQFYDTSIVQQANVNEVGYGMPMVQMSREPLK